MNSTTQPFNKWLLDDGLYLKVGSRVAIQPQNLSKSRQSKANAIGEITAIKGNTASPPCPPFSTEGQRLGGADERDCFPCVLETIRELQPKFAAIENVPGLITCPEYPGQPAGSYFRGVVRTLDSIGYDAEWITIGSGHCTAPFIRERVLLVAISRSVVIDWERTTTWADQARRWAEGFRAAAKRRGVEPGYPLRVVQNASELARPLGVPSRNGIIRRQRAAAGNLLDPRVAAVALQRVLYLSQL